jgi:hypothetical protein
MFSLILRTILRLEDGCSRDEGSIWTISNRGGGQLPLHKN